MTGERTHPILPCADLDEAIAFYQALGFHQTYRQLRPNPYAVVALEDIAIHLAGIEGFDPATSYGSVVVVVPDAESLYATFADGLRDRYGHLPSAGIPRILRLRRKQGTATGFSVVDAGGNWLRFFRAGATEDDDDPAARSAGLARVIEVAARQGDAHGDHARAIAILDRGLARHPGAATVDRVRALAYRAELLIRGGDHDAAAGTLAEASHLPASEEDRLAVAADLAHAREVVLGDRPPV